MTNYEWLVETYRLEKFLLDMLLYDGKSNKDLATNYAGLDLSKREDTTTIRKWLQAEHKEKVFYVRYADVQDLIKRLYDSKKITLSCAQTMCDGLTGLDTKEIYE